MNAVQGKRKFSYFGTSMVADFVLITLVLATMTPFIINTLRTVNERAGDTLSTTVIQASDNLDGILTSLESMLLTSGNEAVSSLAQTSKAATGSDYYTMRKASRYLGSLVMANPTLQDILIAYKQSSIILRANSGFDSPDVLGVYYDDDTLYDEAFSGGISAFFLPSRALSHSSPRRVEEVFGYSFSIGNYGRTRACILVKTASVLSPSVLQSIGEGGFFVMADASGRAVIANGNMDVADQFMNGGEVANHITLRYTSPSGRFTVWAGTPRLLSSGAMARLITLLIFCVLAALVTGLTFAAYSASRQSRPVKRLTEELTHYSNRIAGSESEIEMLQEMLHRLTAENRDFEAQLDAFRQTQYENMITRLFTTSNFTDEDLEHLHAYVGTVPDRYIVAYGKLDNLSLGDAYRDEVSLLTFGYLRQSLPRDCLSYAVSPTAIAVLISDDTDIEHIQLASAATNIRWSYSRVFDGIENISTALEEARMVRQWDGPRASALSIVSFQRLYQYMLAADTENALEQTRDIFAQSNAENIRYCYDCIRFVIYLAAEANQLPAVAPLFDESLPYDLLQQKLHDTIESFCLALNQQKRSHNETLKADVLAYIQANYHDSGLYAASIAEYAGISEKYLYNFVKEQTGMSVGEYLQHLRMNHAVEILREGQVAVKDVYALTGFNSENSFYKAFKRTYGVSPSQYRASNGGEGRPL